LALIEAKRTTKDIEVKHQAFLYANCLEMHGQRPVISILAETKLWDDQFYSSPEDAWFYTKEELQWLIQKRATIKTFVKQRQ
jgi:type I restriction enzyme R subunit